MDQLSKDRLDEILRKEPAALSEGDIQFLRARTGYLTPSDLERYKEVLEPSKPEAPADEAPKSAKKKSE